MSHATADPVTPDFEIALPPPTESLEQNQEWCVVHIDDEWRKINMHDYEAIFSIPGLYERLIYDVLNCKSPTTVRGLLENQLADAGVDPKTIHALDLGAGNGMVGEEILDMGAASVVGIDIIDAAEEAAKRDRPDVYEGYHVIDMTRISEQDRKRKFDQNLNCLVCVAALGFGDIPPEAFANAFKLIRTGGWVAFNIKAEFLKQTDSTGFSKLIWLLESMGALKIRAKQEYHHRLGTDGKPIPYVAVVGRKMVDLPAASFQTVSSSSNN